MLVEFQSIADGELLEQCFVMIGESGASEKKWGQGQRRGMHGWAEKYEWTGVANYLDLFAVLLQITSARKMLKMSSQFSAPIAFVRLNGANPLLFQV